ncbi:MAG: hypothetical protein ACJAQ3_003297 [Planctomycetota bacterium]|jgi:hypothetical protein
MPEESPAANQHPASLKPFSAGCLVPVFLALAVIGLAYMGLQKIVSSTGPWALQAADKALLEAGLPETQRAEFGAEVARLREAFDAETLESSSVVNGVAGLLETPILPLLILNDVVDRRLPASGLNEAQKAELMAAIADFSAAADTQALKYQDMITVLGPLARSEEEGGPKQELDDKEFLAMAERARTATARIEVPKLDTMPTFNALLERYRDHVDAVLAGTAPTVRRSE